MSLRRALIGTGVALGVLLGIELVARLAEPRLAPDHAQARGAFEGHLPPHPYLGWEPTPGPRTEAGVDVRINSLGIRGPEPADPRPSGLRRLIATGDSSVYGWALPEQARFVDRAAAALDMEPWAAAVPGYSTLQTLHWLRLRGDRLVGPGDIVVVANIWSDHSVEAWVDADLLAPAPAGFDIRERSALYRVLRYELTVVRGEQAMRRIHWQRAGAPVNASTPRVPVAAYRDNLAAIAAWVAARGGGLALLAFAHPCDVDDCEVPASFESYRQAQREVGARLGAPVVEGRDAFVASGLPGAELWLDGIHPTAQGHHLLGEALAGALATPGSP